MVLGFLSVAPPLPNQPSVPVIGYHGIGGPPEFSGGSRYDVHGLNISPETFRKQLDLMYANGFWPVNMRDVILKQMSLPPHKRPIVLTFDDGRPSQFFYLENGKLDPNCALGILLQFHRKHPDWPLKGSFYLIAGSDSNGVPFDQEGLEKKKIRLLLNYGFEIGNHSLTHPSFASLSRDQIVREVAGCDAYLKELAPGTELDTFALPYGDLPKSRKSWRLLRDGSLRGDRYHNIGVLLFSGGICPSPYSSQFDPYRIDRIAPAPGVVESILNDSSSPH